MCADARGSTEHMNYFVPRHAGRDDREAEMIYVVTLICSGDAGQKLMPLTRWIFAHMKFTNREQ